MIVGDYSTVVVASSTCSGECEKWIKLSWMCWDDTSLDISPPKKNIVDKSQ